MMIDISLENADDQDIKVILYLKKIGMPDEIIQKAYDTAILKQKRSYLLNLEREKEHEH